VEQAAKLAEVSAIEEVYPYRFIRQMQRPYSRALLID
jgi:hypothetical protein